MAGFLFIPLLEFISGLAIWKLLVILSWESGWNFVAIEDPLPFTLSSLFLKDKKKLYIL